MARGARAVVLGDRRVGAGWPVGQPCNGSVGLWLGRQPGGTTIWQPRGRQPRRPDDGGLSEPDRLCAIAIDRNFLRDVVAIARLPEVVQRGRGQADLAAILDGVAGIDQEVKHGGFKLAGIDQNVSIGGLEPNGQIHIFADTAAQQGV